MTTFKTPNNKNPLKIDNEFGKRLRTLRLEHGFTQEQIVTKLQLLDQDISRSAYAQIECGTYNIRISELRALKSIYNISYDDFFTSPKKRPMAQF